MKYTFILMLLLVAFNGFAQSTTFSVFIRDQVIIASTNDDNKDKLLQINPAQFSDSDVIRINIQEDALDTDWKRIFYVDDASGNSVKNFSYNRDGFYTVSFSQIKKLLQKQKSYFIYTTAFPRDKNKAMLVKPGKQLLCAVKIL